MLNVFDLMLIKESLNGEKIIYIQYGKHEFVFRLISPKEYNQAKLLTSSSEEFNDSICQLALVYPEDYNFSNSPLAGLSDEMSEQIINASMIKDKIGVLDKYEESKAQLEMFINQCMLFVKAAFSEYSLREIEEWPYEKLMDMTAKAEFILKLKGCQYEISYDREVLETEEEEKSDKELVLSGIDPMFYNADKIVLKQPFIDYPVILGSSWDNEEMIDSVRKQILRR